MKRRKRKITDAELDALLSATPVSPDDSFAERTVTQAMPATDLELNALLAADLVNIRTDFTDRTLALIAEAEATATLRSPTMRWLRRSGMAAAILLVGLFSYSIWDRQIPNSESQPIAEADLAGMEFEELLYLEETLSSAKVLIELQKTVPLSYFIEEAD